MVEGVAQLIARDNAVHGPRSCPGGLLSHHGFHAAPQLCSLLDNLQHQQQQGFTR